MPALAVRAFARFSEIAFCPGDDAVRTVPHLVLALAKFKYWDLGNQHLYTQWWRNCLTMLLHHSISIEKRLCS
jgi:hypothetical protein